LELRKQLPQGPTDDASLPRLPKPKPCSKRAESPRLHSYYSNKVYRIILGSYRGNIAEMATEHVSEAFPLQTEIDFIGPDSQ
jgi:hypothetical protein